MRLLRSSSSSLDVGEGNVSIKYLTRKAQCLEPHERVVNIQLDEIHIKSKLSYQSKKLSKLNYSFFAVNFSIISIIVDVIQFHILLLC